MAASERDSTEDWRLGADATPPLLGELVERIEEALDVAYGSKVAAQTAGEAAVEAAEGARDAAGQAHRAAGHAHRSAMLAEQAAESMLEAGRRRRAADGPTPADEGGLRSFSERADRLVARLRALERIPLGERGDAGVV